MYKLKERIKIKELSLNVKNLDKMIDYYTKIGFNLINKTNSTADLGVKDKVLLKFNTVEGEFNKKVTGLYHVAYLVPSRKDLGNILYTLLSKKIEIYGAADHGYSEAIYLYDPEGNGIEIYRDREVSEWNIKDGGKIVGITEQLLADEILEQRDKFIKDVFPHQTKIGHIHLSIKDYYETSEFYENILGFDEKFEFEGQAKFLASNLYHHDIALNIWNSKDMKIRENNDFGLENFVIELSGKEEFEGLKNNLLNYEANLLKLGDKEILIKDNQNINIKFYYKDNN